MRKTYKFRIYPTRKQTIKLLHVFSMCRHLYNDMLHDRKTAYEDCNCGLSFYDQHRWLKYDKAFQNFFRRVKTGEEPGYPRFKGYGRYDSFTYPDAYGVGYKIEGAKLILSKIGAIRIFQHRELVGKVKTCTIRRDGEQWYACFSVELPDAEPIVPQSSVGVDVGIKSLATLSDGTEIPNPKTAYKYDAKLVRAQRDLSRKKTRSHNWYEQKKRVTRINLKIRNIRNDYLHKVSRMLVDTYDIIVMEDLQIKNMVQNHHLARSIHDAAWGKLTEFVAYKAEWAGKISKQVNPRRTSQECCICGNIQKMPLSQRTYICASCGNVIDRDHNAAINIRNRYVPTDCGELTPVEMVA